MFNLNRIIYWLVVFLAVELSLFAGYIILFNILEVKNPLEKFMVPVEEKPLKQEEESTTPKAPVVKGVTIERESVPEKKVSHKNELEAALVHITPSTQEDIISITNSSVKPVIYTKSIPLSTLSIENKKKSFINLVMPSILIAKHRIRTDRDRVEALLKDENLTSEDALWLTKKRYIFKAQSNEELYEKMELHPTSIVIAQAIIESGWGTSRFFEQANNLFGIWSFHEHEARIAAAEMRGAEKVYLKKYTNLEHSINDYFLMLSTKDAYQEFREQRLKSQDPFELIKELGKYSELGDEYIQNLKNTIEKNELLAYDTYRLDF
jgi:Bax protein